MAKGVLSKLPAAFTAQEPTPGLAHGAEATSLIPMSRRMQVLFEGNDSPRPVWRGATLT